jgi:DNA mismatch repair ATPase MutS
VEIAHLNRLIQWLDARRNILFAPLSIFILWTTQLAMAIESWREVHGPHLERWLRAAGEYESLCALSGFAFEQPATCFPEVAADGAPHFAATAARHPLIPFERCVANDVALDAACRLLVVSGSNMSGKSTLLRTIGTNTVLAQMGAPVCATSLTLSPLRIGTSMRTQDSLIDGTSRFYAEIKRLKLVVDLAGGDRPLLFLLDEILHGTNSHDRGIGAEAVVRNLLERGAIGLITTHDLTLAGVADNLAPRARNVHFADQLTDGEMVFDYKMHEGPVQKSNALGLMRAIGLRV